MLENIGLQIQSFVDISYSCKIPKNKIWVWSMLSDGLVGCLN